MTPLEAARRMAANMPTRGGSGRRCYYCMGGNGFEHDSHCPWADLPRIVAVLEAAERYVSLNRRDDVSMVDLMKSEDDLHEAFGDARRYDGVPV